jgi:hypothetical protein
MALPLGVVTVMKLASKASVCAFDPVPDWQKGVESLDERRMTVKKDRYTLNDAWGVNSRANVGVRWLRR